MPPRSPAPLLAAALAAAAPAAAATRPLAPAAPPDEAFLDQWAETGKLELGAPTGIRVLPGGAAVLFLRSGGRSRVHDLYELDVASGQERVLLTAEQLLGGGEEQLSAEELARRERMRLTSRGITSFTVSRDGGTLLVPLSGRLFLVDRASGARRELTSGIAGFPLDPQLSPDGRRLVASRGGNVVVTDLDTGVERPLTSGATEHVTFGTAEFVAQEEMHRFRGTWWSPDAKRLLYQRTDTSALETFTIADPRRPEVAPQSWPYPRAGRNNADVQLGLISAEGGATTWVRWDRVTYPYLAQVSWPEVGPLTILVQDRLQQNEQLLAVNPDTGETRQILAEHDETWINLASGPLWTADGQAFLWMAERGGEWRLELRSLDGALKRSLTPVGFGLRGIVDFDPRAQVVRVLAAVDPGQTHVWEVPVRAGGKPRQLSEGVGNFGLVAGPDHATLVWYSAPWDGARRWRVSGPKGAAELRSVAEAPLLAPNVERVVVGERQLHAAIVRPRAFDPAQRYPVLLHVYGGPTSTMVSASRHAYLFRQWWADQGFIVVTVDGRGTPNRGHDWQRSVYRDLATIVVEDQAAGVEALLRQFPEMDSERVGVLGWSFGGYVAALLTMRRPDVFRAGVAGAPVADWADYDTHYTERYMGLPQENVDGYRAANVLTWAKDLARPLLLVHGTGDDNVYFLHSLRIAEELLRAGKPFDFLPLPGQTHVVADPEVVRRLQRAQIAWLQRQLRG